MSQNTIQNSTIIDLFNPNRTNITQKLVSISTNSNKNTYQLQNIQDKDKDKYRINDKDTKSHIYLFTKNNSKITFPKLQQQSIQIQHQLLYLYVQIYTFSGMDWSIQIQLSDQNKIKRRIIISSKIDKKQIKIFSIKYPCKQLNNNCWINLIIDLNSFMKIFNCQNHCLLKNVTITGIFKLRRIFIAQSHINININKSQNGKNYQNNMYFPSTVKVINHFIKYNQSNDNKNIQISDISTRNQSNFNNQKFTLPIINKRDNSKNTKKTKSNLNTRLPEINHSQTKSKSKNKNLLQQKINLISQSQRLDKNMLNFSAKGKQNKWIKRRLLSEVNTKLFSQKNIQTSYTRYQPITPTYKNTRNFKYNVDPSSQQYLQKSQRFSSLMLKKQVCHEQIQQDLQYQNSILNNQLQNKKENNQQNTKLIKIPQLQLKKQNSFTISEGQSTDNNTTIQNKITQKIQQKVSYQGFGQRILQKFLKQLNRSFSPQYAGLKLIDDNLSNQASPKINKNEIQLIYDPVLQCYYDCKAHNFYQLKR